MTADKDLLVVSIPLATAFTKNMGANFLPPATSSESQQPTPAEGTADANEAELVSLATKEKFRKLLVAYYEALSRRAIREHTVNKPRCFGYNIN